jgi:beta-N-acetylglucosaminidase
MNNVNPIYCVAYALHESDNRKSELSASNNFFGEGATDGNAVEAGKIFAKKQNYLTVELGINGSAKRISEQWINKASQG